MAEVAQQQSVRTLPPELQRAAAVAAGGFLFLAVVLYTDILSVLPAYPAVIVAFLAWLVLPGWLLQRALLRWTGLVEQAVAAFLMSMALAAVPGVAALQFHWSLDTFALTYALVAAAASGAALLWRGEGDDESLPHERPAERSGTAVLLVLVGVPLLAIATAPWWAGDRIARDADDVVYTGYVNEYLHADGLDASSPFLDTRRGSFGRMQANVWVVTEALVAKTAGVEGFELHMQYLPSILTVAAVGAMFALARGLFRSSRLALLAAVLFLMHAALDLAPQEGVGRMILLRMAQDKMAASFIFVPVGLLIGARYLARPSMALYAAMLLALGALFVVHPLGLMSLGVALMSLAALRALIDRSAAALRPGAAVVLPWVVLGVGFLFWSWLVEDRGEILAPFFRRGFTVTELPAGMLIGSHHLLLNPMILAALVLAVPAWLLAPRHIGNQMLAAVVGGILLIYFVPIISTPIAEITAEEAVWRLHRLVPAALVLAYVINVGLVWAAERPVTSFPRWPVWAPGAAVLLVFAAAFFVQEQYAIVDDGAYYNRTSPTELLPWTGGSIFLGGVERAFSSDWRPTDAERDLLQYLRDHAPAGSIVLAPRNLSTRYYQGMLDDVRPVDYRGAPDRALRSAFVDRFYDGELDSETLEEGLKAAGVHYVVVPSRTSMEESVQGVAVSASEAEPIEVFEADQFQPQAGSPTLVELSRGDAWVFAPDVREAVTGATFTVSTTARDGVLELAMALSAGSDVTAGSVARLFVTLEPVGPQGAATGELAHTAFEVPLAEGTAGGDIIVRSRLPGQRFAKGETYRVQVRREGNHADDTYPGPVRVLSLAVLQPADDAVIGAGTYRIFEVE